MEPTETRPKGNSDEIDLAQFFRWIGRGINRIGDLIIYVLATLRNIFFTNKIFFIGIIIVGMALGATYSELLKRKFYKSTMVLSCDYLNTQILQSTIEKLNLLCAEGGREGLAEILKIDIPTAMNIQLFEFKPFVSEDDVVEMEVLRTQLNNVAADKKELVEKVIKKLEIENKNAYQITVQVYNPDIVKPLEKAIVNYFSTNPYIKRRVEINDLNLKQRKAKLISESEKLDSLKVILYQNYVTMGRSGRGSNNVILSDENLAGPLDVFRHDLELNTQLMEIEEELYIKPDFEVVDGFTTFKQPESAGLTKIMIVSFMLSWMMGYLIIGTWKFDKMLAKYPTNV